MSSTKSPWETRVGMLLKDVQAFAWAFKPVDSRLYGGQTRVDWLACDRAGRFWMVEVKSISERYKSINLRTDVSAGQRDALTSITQTTVGISLLAVGRADMLYIFDWGRVLWQWREQNQNNRRDPSQFSELPSSLKLETAPLQIKWTGPKAWETVNLRSLIEQFYDLGIDAAIRPTLIVPERPSPSRASSASTSKPRACTPTPERTLRLVR